MGELYEKKWKTSAEDGAAKSDVGINSMMALMLLIATQGPGNVDTQILQGTFDLVIGDQLTEQLVLGEKGFVWKRIAHGVTQLSSTGAWSRVNRNLRLHLPSGTADKRYRIEGAELRPMICVDGTYLVDRLQLSSFAATCRELRRPPQTGWFLNERGKKSSQGPVFEDTLRDIFKNGAIKGEIKNINGRIVSLALDRPLPSLVDVSFLVPKRGRRLVPLYGLANFAICLLDDLFNENPIPTVGDKVTSGNGQFKVPPSYERIGRSYEDF